MACACHVGAIWRHDREGIGTRSDMRKTKVSRDVALLEGRKLIARRANRADLREALLCLTATGRQVYRQVAPIALEFACDLLETVDADRAALDRALIKTDRKVSKARAPYRQRTPPRLD